jgi:hypothetical protein
VSTTPHHPDCQIIPIAPVSKPKPGSDDGGEVAVLVLSAMVKCHPDCPRRKATINEPEAWQRLHDEIGPR